MDGLFLNYSNNLNLLVNKLPALSFLMELNPVWLFIIIFFSTILIGVAWSFARPKMIKSIEHEIFVRLSYYEITIDLIRKLTFIRIFTVVLDILMGILFITNICFLFI